MFSSFAPCTKRFPTKPAYQNIEEVKNQNLFSRYTRTFKSIPILPIETYTVLAMAYACPRVGNTLVLVHAYFFKILYVRSRRYVGEITLVVAPCTPCLRIFPVRHVIGNVSNFRQFLLHE